MSTTTPLPSPPPTTARCAVALPHSRRAPSLARRVSENWLKATDPLDRVPDAVLVVSELVTNAVRHTSGPCVLTLTVRDGRLDIAVADHSEDLPEVHRRSDGDERGGLGMGVIRGLGGQIRLVPAIGGKTVHVLLDLRTARGTSPDR
ncbi:ATP-binding protein [Streptomyces rishiriensis]|uniref:Anti-sigma regulatory factor (Ser/Thr protein kinase) n=1 Tax=Streptomyces rishiriensis TaxID=68264 RepID=A0ABU0NL24_STRRH|nr:ATP-binding protein [Streptomyces rishiriensis]MDQ0579830.1 anti-sigma regulatory factor (Ser/Thr protein kinase) [Streptomyces rishiriensis]